MENIEKLPEIKTEKKQWIEPKMVELIVEFGPVTPGFDGQGRNT